MTWGFNEVQTALSDGAGVAVNVRDTINRARDTLKSPLDDLTDLFGITGGGGGIDFMAILEKFFKENVQLFADLAKELIDKLPDEAVKALIDLFKRFVTLLKNSGAAALQSFLEALAELYKAFIAVLDSVRTIIETVLEASAKLWQAVVDIVAELFKDIFGAIINALPFALKKGPFDALQGLTDLISFLDRLDALVGVANARTNRIRERIKYVNTSVAALVGGVCAGDPRTGASLGGFLLKSVVTAPLSAVDAVLGGTPPVTAFTNFINSIFAPKNVIDTLKGAFSITNLLKWIELPAGLPIGLLNQWLNDANTYTSPPAPAAPAGAEREYRARLIAALDSYFCSRPSMEQGRWSMERVDERASGALITDLICIFFDTTISFVLEPGCHPAIEFDLHQFEDIGGRLATFSAKQPRLAIRATLGSVLHGFWAWTIRNPNLIEGIGTIAGSIFAPILDGVVKHVSGAIEVRSAYPDSYAADATPVPVLDPNALILWHWESLEEIYVDPGTSGPRRLRYVALLRDFKTTGGGAPTQLQLDGLAASIGGGNNVLLRLLEDFGAYLDVAYRQFRIESRFPNLVPRADVNPTADPFGDQLSVTSAFSAGDPSVVEVTATVTHPTLPNLPRPVLRVYHPCGIVVMQPQPANSYIARFSVSPQRRYLVVTVLSSWGGCVSQAVSR